MHWQDDSPFEARRSQNSRLWRQPLKVYGWPLVRLEIVWFVAALNQDFRFDCGTFAHPIGDVPCAVETQRQLGSRLRNHL